MVYLVNNVRTQIICNYAEWTALSALRSGAPIKSRRDVYGVISEVDFSPLFDADLGAIEAREFDKWHKKTVKEMIANESRLSVGWAAKIINIYLKTRAYVGGQGRSGLSDCIHPPIDGSLWLGLKQQFADRPDILTETNCVTLIKDITEYQCYLRIVRGCRAAAQALDCKLIEVEQLWLGTKI